MDMIEEIRKLRKELKEAHDVINDSVTMMDVMREEIEIVRKRNAELEDLINKRSSKPVKKTSRNSNFPPSSDLNKPNRNNNSREKGDKKSGGQKGATLEMKVDVDKHIPIVPLACDKCNVQLNINENSL